MNKSAVSLVLGVTVSVLSATASAQLLNNIRIARRLVDQVVESLTGARLSSVLSSETHEALIGELGLEGNYELETNSNELIDLVKKP